MKKLHTVAIVLSAITSAIAAALGSISPVEASVLGFSSNLAVSLFETRFS